MSEAECFFACHRGRPTWPSHPSPTVLAGGFVLGRNLLDFPILYMLVLLTGAAQKGIVAVAWLLSRLGDGGWGALTLLTTSALCRLVVQLLLEL